MWFGRSKNWRWKQKPGNDWKINNWCFQSWFLVKVHQGEGQVDSKQSGEQGRQRRLLWCLALLEPDCSGSWHWLSTERHGGCHHSKHSRHILSAINNLYKALQTTTISGNIVSLISIIINVILQILTILGGLLLIVILLFLALVIVIRNKRNMWGNINLG